MSRAQLVLLVLALAPVAACARASDMPDSGAGHDAAMADTGGSSFDAGDVDTGAALDAGGDPDLGVDEDAAAGVDLGFAIDLGPRDDAGGTVDAGGTDAGTPDLGVDMGRPDLGVDMGRPDLGVDMGRPDLGVDMGAPDLGAPDLGTPDFGTPDFGAGCTFGADDTVDGTLRITVDDQYDVYVNGVLLGSDSNWYTTESYPVTLYRHPSRANVIALVGHNGGSVFGRDRGVLLDLVANVGGTDRVLVSDASWRYGAGDPGWSDLGFDDSSWGYAVDQGTNGIGPWGLRPLDAAAGWIWYFDSNVDTSSKPDIEDAYFRRTFYFDASGAISDTPSACP